MFYFAFDYLLIHLGKVMITTTQRELEQNKSDSELRGKIFFSKAFLQLGLVRYG